MKEKKEYDAAFGLLEHCLDIHPNASSALYELSQYYMFLRQVPQGQAALEKAVTYAPDNYWYSQGLSAGTMSRLFLCLPYVESAMILCSSAKRSAHHSVLITKNTT